MKKHFRLLSIFLVLILSFSLFSVNAFAVEDENLVDSNLSNWTDYGDDSDYFGSADVTYLGESVNKITVSSSNYSVILFDLTEFLKIGESYNFNFTLPTTDGANSSALESCQLSWALCDGSGDNVPTVGANVFEIIINNDNKSKYLGTDITFEFTYTQGYKNTFLCLFIAPGDNLEVYEDLTLYVSNLSLERVVPESEKKLDGILGWLQDIWDKLVSIGDGLTEVWTNITSSVSALGDRISGFFSELSNTISTKFNELTTNFSNFITNLGDRISEFFDNLITNVKTFFEELPGKIFNYQVEEDENGNIIGGSGGSDDDTSSNNSLISINDLYQDAPNPDTEQVLFFYDNYARIYRKSWGSCYIYSKSVPIQLEMDCTYKLSFDISNYLNSSSFYPYFLFRFSDGSKFEQDIVGNNHYEYTFYCDTPITLDNVTFCFRSTMNGERRIDISNLQLVKVTDDGSSGGSGEGSSGSVSWFQFIINKFNDWFTGLGNRIINYILYFDDEIPENPFTGVDSPLDHVQGFFDDLIDYLTGIGDDIETVLDSITAPVSLLDTFTKRFEWLFGIITFTLMMIVVSRFIGL